MISEIDIRDWDNIDVQAAKQDLQDVTDLWLVDAIEIPAMKLNHLKTFIENVESLKKKNTKQVPRLFQKLWSWK